MQADARRTTPGTCSFAGTTLDPARGPAAADMTWLVSYQDGGWGRRWRPWGWAA
jgi:hypothetical protein